MPSPLRLVPSQQNIAIRRLGLLLRPRLWMDRGMESAVDSTRLERQPQLESELESAVDSTRLERQLQLESALEHQLRLEQCAHAAYSLGAHTTYSLGVHA